NGTSKQKEFLSKNFNLFFTWQLHERGHLVIDPHCFCGRIIPQSGKNLLTLGIFPEWSPHPLVPSPRGLPASGGEGIKGKGNAEVVSKQRQVIAL
ncbi:MAG: hypothetical protein MUC98_12360, partial [Desulfobacterota bacterium]|nr:hypothetical protein [Thermodesulfobacteriota bacterium]